MSSGVCFETIKYLSLSGVECLFMIQDKAKTYKTPDMIRSKRKQNLVRLSL